MELDLYGLHSGDQLLVLSLQDIVPPLDLVVDHWSIHNHRDFNGHLDGFLDDFVEIHWDLNRFSQALL